MRASRPQVCCQLRPYGARVSLRSHQLRVRARFPQLRQHGCFPALGIGPTCWVKKWHFNLRLISPCDTAASGRTFPHMLKRPSSPWGPPLFLWTWPCRVSCVPEPGVEQLPGALSIAYCQDSPRQ